MRVVVHHCPTAPPADSLPGDEVRVWVVPLDRPPADPDELAAALTPDERDRAARYKAGIVRHQFVTCRGLLRRLLGNYLHMPPHTVPITYTAAGKPVLAGGALHFNLTHTADLALVALARCRVGVDVERVRRVPDMDSLVNRFFSLAEQAAYRDLPAGQREAAFFRGWTCKEAVIKAAGTSVQLLDTFDVELDPGIPPAVLQVRHEAFAGTGWAVGAWEAAAGFAAAVAVEGAGPLAVEWQGQ